MKMVVLDGYGMNPGDMSWQGLQDLGDLTVYDRTAAQDTLARSAGADILLTNKTVLTREIMAQLHNLKLVSVLATGYNVVDVVAARELGIDVCNVPAYSTQSVAQTVFAHVLNLTQHVGHHADTVRDGKWCTSPDFVYWDYPLIELDNLTMGIVGFGRIGQETAKLALAFGMKVLAANRSEVVNPPKGVTMVDLETVFRESDIISLHTPLTPQTEGMVNKALLATMKPTAFLINTSRGPVIVEQDLADALNEGVIAGAGLDVLCKEPADSANPLLGAQNCYITPHVAWATTAARRRLMDVSIANLRAFIAGNPINLVN